MKPLLRAALFVAFTVSPAFAQGHDTGYWRAVSKTASSITGDIQIGADRLVMNFTPFAIANIRPLTSPEVASVFDVAADAPAGGGAIYRLNIPAKKALLHKNTLCGTEDTTYMVTFANGRDLSVAFFSGAALPELKPESIANSTALCGTFSYTR